MGDKEKEAEKAVVEDKVLAKKEAEELTKVKSKTAKKEIKKNVEDAVADAKEQESKASQAKDEVNVAAQAATIAAMQVVTAETKTESVKAKFASEEKKEKKAA